MDLAALEERLGYTFVQRALIEQAVTHRSHGAVHNERLEFLGDAVLNCAVAHLLYAEVRAAWTRATCRACGPIWSSSVARRDRRRNWSWRNSCGWVKAR